MRKLLLLALLLTAALPTPSFSQGTRMTSGPGAHGPLTLIRQRPLFVPGEWIVKFRHDTPDALRAQLHAQAGATVLRRTAALDLETVRLPPQTTPEAYRRDSNVLWVEPNACRYPLLADPNDVAYDTLDTATPNDPSQATWFKWDAHLIQCVDGWSLWPNIYYSYPGVPKPKPGVRIAIIDSGIDYGHPDFVNAGAASADSAVGGQLDEALDVSILNGVQTPLGKDEFGHGTHVSGIAAAATNNGGVGVTGNGYNATVLTVKVIDASGNGTESDIVAGMTYAADHGALIENLSLGGYAYSQAEQDAVNYCWNKGTMVIAAAGNDGTDTQPVYPGALSRVLAVSATSSEDSLAAYSDYGDQIGIAAPGGDFNVDVGWFVDVYSTMPTYYVTLNDPNVYGATETYSYLEGTSMACPQVVGLAALYAGMKGYTQTPGVPLLLWQALQRGCDNIGGNGWEPDFGYGRINVYGTMNLAANPNPRGDTVGCIVGTVRYKGTVVANGTLSAVPVGGGPILSASSRGDGGFRVVNAPAGTYSLSATVFGESQTLGPLVVTAGCDLPAVDFNIGVSAPTLTGMSTLYATRKTTPISVVGTGFASGAVASLNGTALATTFVSATLLKAVVPAASLAASGTASAKVVNPGGTVSNTLSVPVLPVVSGLSLSPGAVAGGTPSTATLTLSAPALKGGERVTLTSSLPTAAKTPSYLVVPAGAATATFTVQTFTVSKPVSVIIKAGAGAAAQATLSVH